ncbi:MAG TPA: arginase family protein, partial [bacterium]|nr:arginase family protein [bacterium]
RPLPARTGVGGEFVKVNPENTVLVGIRTLDDGEIDNIRRMGVTVFTMRDIDEQGMSKIIRQAIDIAARDTAGIHVSFDADSMDPSIAPGVGTPVPGGLTYRETHLAMESLCDSKKVISAEIVETNPILDIKNTTAHVGVEMMASLFGKRIM